MQARPPMNEGLIPRCTSADNHYSAVRQNREARTSEHGRSVLFRTYEILAETILYVQHIWNNCVYAQTIRNASVRFLFMFRTYAVHVE